MVLHDTRSGRLVQVGPREWGLLASADGTRDLDGIVLAATRAGSFARAPALRAFLEQLHGAGMIADGIEEASPPSPGRALWPLRPVPPDRPLDVLPGFTLSCDGSGSCCRIYASVLFAPVEAARARAVLPAVLDGGTRHRHVFMPEHGAGPCAASAVTLSDGRCAYLADGGLCSLHAAAGEAAKPLGCRLFPATFTDDGEAVRVSVAVECACVLASVDRVGGAPLTPPGARVRGDLDDGVFIAEVPDHVRLTPSAWARREDFVAFSRRVLGALGGSATGTAAPAGQAIPDVPGGALARLWSLASAVEAEGLLAGAERRALDGASLPAPRDILPWIEALRARAARRAREDSAWRSESDLARRATRWIEAAAASLLEPGACQEALRAELDHARSEAFYLRAVIHGCHLAEEPDADADDGSTAPDAPSPSVSAWPLASSLRDRAVRLLVARAMPGAIARSAAEDAAGALDPATAHPLALVEAMLRGHGLESYRSDIE